MDISIKERVYQALVRLNYFDCGKKDSLEVFKKAKHLEDVVIEVERNCNVDKILFRYNPSISMFCRVAIREEDKELLHRESQYKVHPTCLKRQCLNHKICIDTFIELLGYAFEPIAIYSVDSIKLL